MAIPKSGTVPISFVRELLVALPVRADQEAMVERAGIAPPLLDESGARVTTDQFSRLYRLLARELDNELPGMFSRAVRGGTLKLMCLSMLDSANLMVALHRMSLFFRLILDDVNLEVSQESGVVCVSLAPMQENAGIRVFSQEIVLKVVHGVVSWLAKRMLPLARADFCYPRPEHVAAYAFLYPGPTRFDQARTALYFEAGDLDVPTRQSKRTLSLFLERAPADWLFVSFAERIIRHRLREFLETRLQTPTSIADVAAAFHLSVRTLARRLDDEDTSFQVIKDELRRDVAIQRLTKSNTQIALIGAEIGFDDPTAFCRAFKRWTGSTPGAYRVSR